MQTSLSPQSDSVLRVLRVLRAMVVVVPVVAAAPVAAHDLERTQVRLTFARDGSFTLDVSNDPNWLKLRLQPFGGNFLDRVVLWVDGREVRPSSIEYIPGEELAIHRMHGRVPIDARTLRWYYGLVVDPYPLAIRRADGRVIVEEIQGDAWSGTIDLSGQFTAPLISERAALIVVVALVMAPLAILVWRRASPRSQP
jgi:hypothetical protein